MNALATLSDLASSGLPLAGLLSVVAVAGRFVLKLWPKAKAQLGGQTITQSGSNNVQTITYEIHIHTAGQSIDTSDLLAKVGHHLPGR